MGAAEPLWLMKGVNDQPNMHVSCKNPKGQITQNFNTEPTFFKIFYKSLLHII
jgi:hypothetical protein